MLAWASQVGHRLSTRFLDIADEDAEAYGGFSAALKLPRDTDDERSARTTAMQAAEVLGLPVELIKSSVGDSDDGGFSSGTWASRTTHATGLAAYELQVGSYR